MRYSAKHINRTQRGQSLVEAAFAIPFMLLCVMGIIYFGRAMYIDQILVYAAQEGARAAAAIPNLNDPTVRSAVRGFDDSGQQSGTTSVIASILGSANLLSGGQTGSLPASAKVKILPWDGDGSVDDTIPDGTVAVRIVYPFSLFTNPFTGQSGDVKAVNITLTANSGDTGVPFGDFQMSERATVAQTVYQKGVN